MDHGVIPIGKKNQPIRGREMKTYTINLQVLSLYDAICSATQVHFRLSTSGEKVNNSRDELLDAWTPTYGESLDSSDEWRALARQDIETCLKVIEEDDK